MSRWLPNNAGVPQGTKLGPILFVIMTNDLKIVFPRSSNWKYVDDVTISEIVPTREVSILQNELDAISDWTNTNNMKLNPKSPLVTFSSHLSTRYRASSNLLCSG